jgi:hypothetical protein
VNQNRKLRAQYTAQHNLITRELAKDMRCSIDTLARRYRLLVTQTSTTECPDLHRFTKYSDLTETKIWRAVRTYADSRSPFRRERFLIGVTLHMPFTGHKRQHVSKSQPDNPSDCAKFFAELWIRSWQRLSVRWGPGFRSIFAQNTEAASNCYLTQSFA